VLPIGRIFPNRILLQTVFDLVEIDHGWTAPDHQSIGFDDVRDSWRRLLILPGHVLDEVGIP
jgi:hypothetical protein